MIAYDIIENMKQTRKESVTRTYKLLPQQELFCQWYTTPGETFCHGTYSYSRAYEHELATNSNGTVIVGSPNYLACKANASRLMFSTHVRERITELLMAQFNEKTADAKVAEIMQRGKDSDALQAVKIFNDLKQRVTKKIDVTTQGRPLAGMTDEELLKMTE